MKLMKMAAVMMAVCMASSGARAQVESFPSLPTRYTPGQIFRSGQLRLSHSVMRSMTKARMGAGRRTVGGAGRGTSGPGARAAAGGTTFRPSGASIMPGVLARDIAARPEDRAELERVFTDLLENYKGRLRQRGAEPNDVARAASFLISASYIVYREGETLSDTLHKTYTLNPFEPCT